MSLREKQSLFARYLARLILWIEAQGWEITLSEGYVGDTDAADGDYDGPHVRGGLHYLKLAQDFNLFVSGKLKATSCPEWYAVGQYWKTLDPQCAWGGDFKSQDYNHVSLRHEGKA